MKDLFTTKNLAIDVIPSNIYVYIEGGNRMSSILRNLILLGNQSYDPDIYDKKESLESLNLEWSCRYDNKSICEFLNGNKILI